MKRCFPLTFLTLMISACHFNSLAQVIFNQLVYHLTQHLVASGTLKVTGVENGISGNSKMYQKPVSSSEKSG